MATLPVSESFTDRDHFVPVGRVHLAAGVSGRSCTTPSSSRSTLPEKVDTRPRRRAVPSRSGFFRSHAHKPCKQLARIRRLPPSPLPSLPPQNSRGVSLDPLRLRLQVLVA